MLMVIGRRLAISGPLIQLWLLLLALNLMLLAWPLTSLPLFPASSDWTFSLVTGTVILLAGLLLPRYCRPQLGPLFLLASLLATALPLLWLTPPQRAGAVLTALSAQLFFLSRPFALGLTTAAALCFSLGNTGDGRLMHRAHLLALLAGTLFLGGEIAGSYWSFVGWGRSWSWSSHFLFSALVYLLLVLVFHLPRRRFASPRGWRRAQGALLWSVVSLMVGYRLL